MNADTGARPSKIKWLVVGCLLAATGYLLFQMRRQVVPALNALEAWVSQAGMLGPILLILVIGVWLALLLPAPLVLGIAGTAYAHNPLLAVLVSSLGVGVAQCSGFLLTRFYLRESVSNKLGHRVWFQKLSQTVDKSGARGVFVIRILPVFPNTLCNYALGLTNIAFGPYLLASVAGSLPLVTVLVLGTSGLIHLMEST
jgi:uncharacterized membrane protein YdjX (TVP38/TMEM64 family)